MAKLTWLGEDDLHVTVDSDGVSHQGAGPSFNLWNGIKFPKDVPVEVTDAHMIAKSRGNKFFKVEDDEKRGPGRPPKVKHEPDPD